MVVVEVASIAVEKVDFMVEDPTLVMDKEVKASTAATREDSTLV